MINKCYTHDTTMMTNIFPKCYKHDPNMLQTWSRRDPKMIQQLIPKLYKTWYKTWYKHDTTIIQHLYKNDTIMMLQNDST